MEANQDCKMPIISVMKCHNPANMVHVNDCEFWSGVILTLTLVRLFLFLTYLERLGLLGSSFGIDSLANGLGRVGSFDLGRRIDELKEQKAINIVGESNIERKLWWDLGSIDMLMSRSVFLGRTCVAISGLTFCPIQLLPRDSSDLGLGFEE
uniref:Uncharacterized protein n=1 Tax=Salix viminalis TaxID=40686 RepID=A0A6N2L818_SALVM